MPLQKTAAERNAEIVRFDKRRSENGVTPNRIYLTSHGHNQVRIESLIVSWAAENSFKRLRST